MSVMTRLLHRLFLTVARLFLVAWIGGAALFVITSIAEQRTPEFNSTVKNRLATVRFPLYYLFGLICLSTSIAATGLAVVTGRQGHKKTLIAGFALCLLSAGVTAYDYYGVYLPLQNAITPPELDRGPEFHALHTRSRVINEIHVSIALIAAVLICLPTTSLVPPPEKHIP